MIEATGHPRGNGGGGGGGVAFFAVVDAVFLFCAAAAADDDDDVATPFLPMTTTSAPDLMHISSARGAIFAFAAAVARVAETGLFALTPDVVVDDVAVVVLPMADDDGVDGGQKDLFDEVDHFLR
jgi:hypothetical protein